MVELHLTNKEVDELLKILKLIFKEHTISLDDEPVKGEIVIRSNQLEKLENRMFRLNYFYTETKKQFNFMDEKTKYTDSC